MQRWGKVLAQDVSHDGFGPHIKKVITGAILLVLTLTYVLLRQEPLPSKGYNTSVRLDLRNAATAQEVYYINNQKYADSCAKLIGDTDVLYLSKGVTLIIISADKNHYKMVAIHERGDRAFSITGPDGNIEEISEVEATSMKTRPALKEKVKILCRD